MSDSNTAGIIAIKVNSEVVSLAETLFRAQFAGKLGFIDQVIETFLIRQEASRLGITVSDKELQEAADHFRSEKDLLKADNLYQWLHSKHISVYAWEACLEDGLLRQKLSQAITADEIEKYFATNILDFEYAIISRIVVATEDLAKELKSQMLEEDADFHQLARSHSTDVATQLAGGFAGKVYRRQLSSAAEASVFGASPGSIVGPFKTDSGWELLKVESRQVASLDQANREAIEKIVFAEWLADKCRKAPIEIPFFELLEESE